MVLAPPTVRALTTSRGNGAEFCDGAAWAAGAAPSTTGVTNCRSGTKGTASHASGRTRRPVTLNDERSEPDMSSPSLTPVSPALTVTGTSRTPQLRDVPVISVSPHCLILG